MNLMNYKNLITPLKRKSKLTFILALTMTALHSQSADAQQIHVHGQKSLQEVFSIIRKETHYNIIASSNQIDLNTIVTVNTQSQDIEKILE